MGFLAEVFAIGAIGFWAVLFVAGIAVSILVDEDRLTAAGFVALGVFAILWLLGDFHPITFVTQHPVQALLAIPGYVVVAIVWGMLKWKLFLFDRRKAVDEVKVRFDAAMADETGVFEAEMAYRDNRDNQENREDGTSPDGLWDRGVERRRSDEFLKGGPWYAKYGDGKSFTPANDPQSDTYRATRWERMLMESRIHLPVKPLASANKTRIIAWMIYWPASAVWTLINDPVRRLAEFTYNSLAGMFQGMADRQFKDVEDAYKVRR